MQPDNYKIAIATRENIYLEKSLQLAKYLDLPLLPPGQDSRLALRYTDKGLELVITEPDSSQAIIRVDFTDTRASRRRKEQKKEMVVRAVGWKPGISLHLVDATAGLGRDSFVLAAAGCMVSAYEQNPVTAALLADGLERAQSHPETTTIADRISLKTSDALPRLLQMSRAATRSESAKKNRRDRQPDVIYLDPMFPRRQKSALVKKELQLLQLLNQQPVSATPLLEAALGAARKRVVVKRPGKAPPLTDRPPSHQIMGKTIRFDVYMII